MFSGVFLAMTARELADHLPKKAAYMACHFSPYSTGLSNTPRQLPENSILLVDDSIPIQGHNPEIIVEQLQEILERFSINAVILDFQRELTQKAEQMVTSISQALSCPVAVTEPYAVSSNCPVFLSSPPANKSLINYLKPWLNREIYLEIAPQTWQITVTETGSCMQMIDSADNLPLEDSNLHCHYKVQVLPDQAIFTLQRTKKDLAALADQAYQLGVRSVVGLYQELCKLQ